MTRRRNITEMLYWGACRSTLMQQFAIGVQRHSSSLASAHRLGAAIHFVPIDVLKKRVDIAARIRPVIDGIGVLVHIHHEQRHAPGKAVRMIPRPIIMYGVVAEIVVQNDPA